MKFLLLALLVVSCASTPSSTVRHPNLKSALTYDPGPLAGESKWPELFGKVPNLAKLEKDYFPFDNIFDFSGGSAIYRGRLLENQVKVLILGQDAFAPFSFRSFTGARGIATDNFLHSIGIDSSYLYLGMAPVNIDEQFSQKKAYYDLTQRSPLAAYRNKLIEYALSSNSKMVNLILSLGNDGKNSIDSFVKNLGKNCDTISCQESSIQQKFGIQNLKIINLPDPLIGNNAWHASAAVSKALIESIRKTNQNFLVPDTSEWQGPIPEKDLPYSAKVNILDQTFRRDRDQWEISTLPAPVNFPLLANDPVFDVQNPFPEMGPLKDSPFFWPSSPTKEGSDPGPCGAEAECKTAKLIDGLEESFAWPDFKALGAILDPQLDFTGTYRGRLANAEILILCDPTSPDDFISYRALTGSAGQKLQNFLRAMGINKSYGILKILPSELSGLSEKEMIKIVTNKKITRIRNKIIEEITRKSKTRIVITIGPAAKYVWLRSPFDFHSFYLDWPANESHVLQWNKVLQQISKINYQTDIAPSFKYTGKGLPIPRYDLPFHAPWWIGSLGDRVIASEENSLKNGSHFLIRVPSIGGLNHDSGNE